MNIIFYNGVFKKYWIVGSEFEFLFVGKDFKNKGVWILGYVINKKNFF